MNETTQESSIAALLRDEILRGQYREGERLPSERDLAERFGVHRSTVQSAVKRLEQLGIAEVRPGGARVNPIAEASLDVLEPWLALNDPPDADLVDQILDTLNGFLAHAARVGTERASHEERAGILAILSEMIESAPSERRRGELFEVLSEKLVAASRNPVLALMRHSLRTRYSNLVIPDSRRRSTPNEELAPDLKRLRTAIRKGEGSRASDAVYGIITRIRKAIRSDLERQARTARQGESR
jgi:GntR family transcriptional repressor for pyruvate dehydrogenase complex